MATPSDPYGGLPPPGGSELKASTSESNCEVASASERTDVRSAPPAQGDEKCRHLELRLLLKDAIAEASTDLDVEPSSSDKESASESSVASDTVQEIETGDDGNDGNRTGAGNAGNCLLYTSPSPRDS